MKKQMTLFSTTLLISLPLFGAKSESQEQTIQSFDNMNEKQEVLGNAGWIKKQPKHEIVGEEEIIIEDNSKAKRADTQMPDFNELYRLVKQVNNEEISWAEVLNKGFTQHDILRLAAHSAQTALINDGVVTEEDKAGIPGLIERIINLKQNINAIKNQLNQGIAQEEIIKKGYNIDDINAALQPDIILNDVEMSQNPVENIATLLKMAPNTTDEQLSALGFTDEHVNDARNGMNGTLELEPAVIDNEGDEKINVDSVEESIVTESNNDLVFFDGLDNPHIADDQVNQRFAKINNAQEVQDFLHNMNQANNNPEIDNAPSQPKRFEPKHMYRAANDTVDRMPDFHTLHREIQQGHSHNLIHTIGHEGYTRYDLVRLFAHYINDLHMNPEEIPGLRLDEIPELLEAIADFTNTNNAIKAHINAGMTKEEIIALDEYYLLDINAAFQTNIQLNNQDNNAQNNQNFVQNIIETLSLNPALTNEQLQQMGFVEEDIQTARLIGQNPINENNNNLQNPVNDIIELITADHNLNNAALRELGFTENDIATARAITGIQNPVIVDNSIVNSKNQPIDNPGTNNGTNNNNDNNSGNANKNGHNGQLNQNEPKTPLTPQNLQQGESRSFISRLFDGWTPVIIFGPIVALISYLWYKKAPAKQPLQLLNNLSVI